MSRPSAYPRELRERAVRMVAEVRPNYESEYAAIAAGQTVVDRRTGTNGSTVVELTYEHHGEPWWQGHWMIRFGEDRLLVITAQAGRPNSAQTRAAAEAVASSLG